MADPYAFAVQGTIHIAASEDAVYDRVSDITRFGEWSPECTGGEWLDSRRGVGASFLGRDLGWQGVDDGV